MSETYINNGLGGTQIVRELFIKNNGTAQELQELYVRNPLAAAGYDIVYVTSDQSVNVTIISLTQDACVDGEVTCIATTGLGTLTYSFEIEFSPNNWLPVQNGPSNIWGNVTTFSLPEQLVGYDYRCVVTANSGDVTDVATASGGTLQEPCAAVDEDWDTNQLGAGAMSTLSSNYADIDFNAAYPNVTTTDQLRTFDPFIRGTGNGPESTMANYVAVYYPEGWRVFGPKQSVGGSEYQYQPLAWPSGFSPIQSTNNLDAQVFVSLLSDYEGSLGEGATDDWTYPSELVPPSLSALQQITWNMTSGTTATVTSTGIEVIDPDTTTQLGVSGGPRFWNGSEANNYGATNKTFGSGPLCADWWEENYWARIRQDGGPWIAMQRGGDIWTACQPAYNNIGGYTGSWDLPPAQWIPLAAGQVVDIEIYTKGELPDDGSTYGTGGGAEAFPDGVFDDIPGAPDFLDGFPGFPPGSPYYIPPAGGDSGDDDGFPPGFPPGGFPPGYNPPGGGTP